MARVAFLEWVLQPPIGSIPVADALMEQHFDHMFFLGHAVAVGRDVLLRLQDEFRRPQLHVVSTRHARSSRLGPAGSATSRRPGAVRGDLHDGAFLADENLPWVALALLIQTDTS